MSPSPPFSSTLPSSSSRWSMPLQTMCGTQIKCGFCISSMTLENRWYLFSKGRLSPGTSKTMYFTFLQASSSGVCRLVMETSFWKESLSSHNSPSNWEFGQFSTKYLGKQILLPFREYIVEPVHIILIPSNFSLMSHPVGSQSSDHVSARRTGKCLEQGLPRSLEVGLLLGENLVTAWLVRSARESWLEDWVFLVREGCALWTVLTLMVQALLCFFCFFTSWYPLLSLRVRLSLRQFWASTLDSKFFSMVCTAYSWSSWSSLPQRMLTVLAVISTSQNFLLLTKYIIK